MVGHGVSEFPGELLRENYANTTIVYDPFWEAKGCKNHKP